MSLHRLPILVHDELGVVPLNKVAHGSGQLVLQIFVQGYAVGAVHFAFGEDVADVCLLLGQEAGDFFAGSWFLTHELVAWERQYSQT